MNCPNCGGSRIFIEDEEYYCLTESGRGKCLYHFTAEERLAFRRFLIQEEMKRTGLSYNTVRSKRIFDLIKARYFPPNAVVTEEDKKNIRAQNKRQREYASRYRRVA